MMPARLAPSVCQAKRASSGPCCRSLGHTRNTYGFIPDRSGLDADGEIIGVGVAPPPYTRAAEGEGAREGDGDRPRWAGAGRQRDDDGGDKRLSQRSSEEDAGQG